MLLTSARRAFVLAGIALVLAGAGCGKKAPLRLSEDRVAEQAPALRARVRDGRVTLDFRVPAHRSFPEREEPWVLARILRQVTTTLSFVEVGTILKEGGFAFGSSLAWSDQGLPAKGPFIYRVEFRDARRRRRALSEPLSVSWDQVPDAPPTLTATGHLRSVILAWAVPGAAATGKTYRIYRRETPQSPFETVTPEPVTAGTFTDARIESGRDYCYVVRAVLNVETLEIEGPPSPESCARSVSEELPAP